MVQLGEGGTLALTARQQFDLGVHRDPVGPAPDRHGRLGGTDRGLRGRSRAPSSRSAPDAGAEADPVQQQRSGDGRRRIRLEYHRHLRGRPRRQAGPTITTPSIGGAPFGFDFDRAGYLLVSDAALTTGQSGATSYDVARDGTVTANGPAVPIDQAAACWLAAAAAASPSPRTRAAARSAATPSRPRAPSLLSAARWSRTTRPPSRSTRASARPELPVRPGGGLTQIVGYRVGADGSLTQVTTVPADTGSAGVGAS